MNKQAEKLLIKLSASLSLGDQLELLERLIVDEQVSTSTIQAAVGWKDYHIRHLVRLINKLCPEVRYLISQNKVTFSLARALASLPESKQEDAVRTAISRKISVHDFRKKLSKSTNTKLVKDLARQADIFSGQTGLDIEIVPKKNNDYAGSWIIHYHDLDMFDTIKKRLRVKDDF
jgi:hypothetical protein